MSSSLARLLTRRNILVAVGTLLVIAALAFVVEAVLAAFAMNTARSDGDAVATSLNSGDLQGAKLAAARLEKDAKRARSYTDDPLWWAGSHVPFLGHNVAAVQKSATALDAIARSSLPVLLNLADEVEHGTLRPQNGRIAPEAIASFAPQVRAAAAAVDGPSAAVERINTSGLIPPLNSLMRQVQDRIGQARVAIDSAANAFEVLPTMLGGSGPRDYLLLVQNPAEIRSAGGLPGTWALIHADNGHLSMTSTTFLGQLGQTSNPLAITAEESQLFGSDFGRIPNEITESPDFPRVAQIASAIEKRRGADVSAVFAVDPMALAYVLAGTGPVSLSPTEQLNAANAVPFLLNQLYLTTDFQTQNSTFSLAARRTFDALVTGQGSQVNAIRGLVQGVMHNRVFAWSADPTLAKVIDGERLDGAFPADTGITPHVGVYLNDTVAGKPDYYLNQSSSVRALSCHQGVQTLEVQASFASTMPADAARFPLWVVGTGQYEPKGTIGLNVLLAGPWKGSVDSLTVDGHDVLPTTNQLDGRQIANFHITLSPGQLVTVTSTMHTGPGQTGNGLLTWTPGMSLNTDPSTFRSAC